MKCYLPMLARKPRVTTFLGRTVLRRCFARKVPTRAGARRQPQRAERAPTAAFPSEGAPGGEQSTRPARQVQDRQLCTPNFIHFARFDGRPVIRVLECIYAVKLKPTVISTMELRISEPTSWIRHWFLLLCHNVNIFGINNVLIDLHPVVPKESSSVSPAPLRSARCQKCPSSPAERSQVRGKHRLSGHSLCPTVTLAAPSRSGQSGGAQGAEGGCSGTPRAAAATTTRREGKDSASWAEVLLQSCVCLIAPEFTSHQKMPR